MSTATNKWQSKLNEKVILRGIYTELVVMNKLLEEGLGLNGRVDSYHADLTTLFSDAEKQI